MPIIMLNFLNKYKWHLTGIISVLILVISSYFYGKKSVKPTIITKVEIKEKIVEKEIKVKVESKDTKKSTEKTIIKKPDGTIIETIKEIDETKVENTDKTTNSVTQEKEKIKKPEVVYKPEKKYKIGVSTELKNLKKPFEKKEYSIWLEGGAKLIGPLWLEGGFNIDDHSAKIGISLNF